MGEMGDHRLVPALAATRKLQKADSALSRAGACRPSRGATPQLTRAVTPPTLAAALSCALTGSQCRSAATMPSPAFHCTASSYVPCSRLGEGGGV